jgi:phage terminase Nu1 subunit (DNA packaging protein)
MLRKIVCSRVELADLLALSEQRVGVLTKTGILTRDPKGYDLRAAVRSYLNFARSRTGTLSNERSRLTRAQADLAELKYREREGELVRRCAVKRELFATARPIRDRLENIPARTAGLVAAESSQEKCFEILQREVRQALEGLTHEDDPKEEGYFPATPRPR